MAGQQDETNEDRFGRQDFRRSSTLSSVIVVFATVAALALVYFFFS